MPLKDLEQRRAYNRMYREAHRQYLCEKKREWNSDNKEKRREDFRRWREENKEHRAEYNKAYAKVNRKQVYANKRRRTYGLTNEQYEELLIEQQNRCAICEKEMEMPCIDHCHDEGKVRGLLCHRCNLGIGMFKDNITYFKNAIKYLTKREN